MTAGGGIAEGAIRRAVRESSAMVLKAVAAAYRFNAPPCPCCGGDISERFASHLHRAGVQPGDSGDYECPFCGTLILYRLAPVAVIDVLPRRDRRKKGAR